MQQLGMSHALVAPRRTVTNAVLQTNMRSTGIVMNSLYCSRTRESCWVEYAGVKLRNVRASQRFCTFNGIRLVCLFFYRSQRGFETSRATVFVSLGSGYFTARNPPKIPRLMRPFTSHDLANASKRTKIVFDH
jgi:hypothetical protein